MIDKKIVAIAISIMMSFTVFMVPSYANDIEVDTIESDMSVENMLDASADFDLEMKVVEDDKGSYQSIDGQYSIKYMPYEESKDMAEEEEKQDEIPNGMYKSIPSYGSSTASVFLNDCSTNFAFLDLNSRSNVADLQYLYMAILEQLEKYYEYSYNAVKQTIDGEEYYELSLVSIKGMDITPEEMLEVYMRVLYDHPLFFFSANEIRYNGIHLILTMDKAFASGATRTSYINKVTTLVKELAATASGAVGNYSACKMVHDRLLDRADYAWDGDEPLDSIFSHNIVGIVKDGKVVCDGYSKAYSAVLNYLDIKAVTVPGWAVKQGDETPDSSAHAWNIVQLGNKKYYFVDVTWDDDSLESTDFFCKGTSFYETHSLKRNTDSTGFLLQYTTLPTISETDYGGGEDKYYKIDNPVFKVKDKVSYSYNSSTKTLTFSGNGMIKGYEDYTKNGWHKYAGTAEKLVIKDGITGVGNFTFYYFKKLKTIDFPNQLETLGQQAFFGCASLQEIYLPDGITFYDGSIFGDCTALRTVVFGTMEETGYGVCNDNMFEGCKNLKKIEVPEGHPIYQVKNGVLFSGSTLHCYPAALTKTSYTVPNGTTGLASRAFSYCNYLKTIKLPETMQVIDSAFHNCGQLTSLTIPEGVTSLAGGIYEIEQGCDNLKTIINNSNAKLVLSNGENVGTGWFKYWKNASTGKIAKYIYKGTAKAVIIGSRKSLGDRFKVNGVTYEIISTPLKISLDQMLEGKVVAKVKTTAYEPGFKTPGNTVKYRGWTYTVSKISILKPSECSTVSATLYGYDDIKASWSKAKNAYGYKVYYKRSGASKYTYAGKTTVHSMKIGNLRDGKKYYFKVVPYITLKGKTYTKSPTKTAYVYTLKKISRPKVKKVSSSKTRVYWSNISGETGYQISKSTSKTGTDIVSTYKTTKGTYKTLNTTKSKKYYYKVRAYKVVNGTKIYGPWSTTRSYILR